ncbi:MAG TPA: creatininase family protein [bacterium]|nr:creatininase family protein [bacterium]
MEKYRYEEMTYNELDELDRINTVFLSSISPLETHGKHLPIGTDVFIAENIRDRIAVKITEKYPEFSIVIMPTLYIGSDAIPVRGSMKIRYQSIYNLIVDTGLTLSKMGFKYWVLTDNHGGPHHQFAIELAARKLAKKGFYVIAPFLTVFRRMVDHDPDLIEKTGLGPGECGDIEDSHAGTNETSLMLAVAPEKIRDIWKETGTAKAPVKKIPYYLLSGISKVLGMFGATDESTDFRFLAGGLSWISDPEMDPYQGDPSKARKEAGEAMLNYHAGVGMELFEKARKGHFVKQKPLGWSIRSLKDIV